ncbi:MAG: 6-phosphofructokinase [Acholeplasmatales bacterium]|nr:6-phosphofructokinase [Acholeplasmatales bacterium]MBQ6782534.1 6-phosphofructokinase [Acholeplasmatales bacterium]
MRFGVLTSGGDAPGMNATIRAVVRAGIANGDQVFGIYDGYRGLVEGKIVEFSRKDVSEILNKGGTILGTARLPEFKYEQVRALAVKQLIKHDIEALICIGGDGTYTGALRLHEMGIKTIGIPGTIDNDIASTDFTIGFSTALNTACDAIDKLRDTSSSHQRCSIIEVMGRHCGDLALYSGICCGAEYIITNETGLDKDDLLAKLKVNRLAGRKHAIVVISENMTDVYQLAKEVETYSGYECRATVLGYVQRGGAPTPEDRLLAARLGKYSVDLLHEGVTGVAVGVKKNELHYTPIEEALAMKNEPNEELHKLVLKIS